MLGLDITSIKSKRIIKILLYIYIAIIIYMFFIYTFKYGTHEYVVSEYVEPYVAQSINTDREPHTGYTLLMFKYVPFISIYKTFELYITGHMAFGGFARGIIFPLLFWLPAGFFLYSFNGTFKKKLIIFIAILTVMLFIRPFFLIECFFVDEVILSTLSCLIGFSITKAVFDKMHGISSQ